MPEMSKPPLAALLALLLLPAFGAQAQMDPGPEETIPDEMTPDEAPAEAAAPQEPAPTAQEIVDLLERFSDDPDRFTQTGGKALYDATCLACHMEDGRGAEGAGAYPPLVDNPKMNSRHFVAGVILTGHHGMPGFDDKMSDEQVAEVTNYIRSHFGNHYADTMTADEVADLRPSEDAD